VETHCKFLAENLAKLGVTVTIHTLGNKTLPYREEKLGENLYKKTYGLNFVNKKEVPPYLEIAKNIRNEKPDLVHL
jgi:hypothetical protein